MKDLLFILLMIICSTIFAFFIVIYITYQITVNEGKRQGATELRVQIMQEARVCGNSFVVNSFPNRDGRLSFTCCSYQILYLKDFGDTVVCNKYGKEVSI